MKTKKHSRARLKKTSGLAEAAVAATVELGHAAESFQESLDHLKKARDRGGKITRRIASTVKRTSKKVVKTAKKTMKRRR